MSDHLRVPPCAIESEQSVLGSIMLDERAYAKISDWLTDADFYQERHAALYRVLGEMIEQQIPVDPVTVCEWVNSNGAAESVGGSDYVLQIVNTQASSANVTAYAEIVREKAALRTLIDVGCKLTNSALDPQGRSSRDIAGDASTAVMEITGRTSARSIKSAREVLNLWFTEIQRRYEVKGLIGMPTPWSKLNKITSGLCSGDLIYLAARPSMGKSAMAVNLALSAANRGKRVLFFNLEMTAVSIMNRCIAATQRIPLSWLRQPDDEQDNYWAKVTAGIELMKGAELMIDDQAGLTAKQIVGRAKREHLRKAVDLVIVDHMHIIARAGKNVVNEIAEDSRNFKALAKSLQCPVLVLSQLNRSLESRADKRPMMSDLRESGALEQDADLVLFMYRDDYYAKAENRHSEFPGLVELIIAKQREGEAGETVWMRDQLPFSLLDEYEGPDPQRMKKQPKQEQAAGLGGNKRIQSVPGKDRAAGHQ